MDSRAPRFGQIEIPLTLTTPQGDQVQCACVNISSSGALLRFLDEGFSLTLGMQFKTKMLEGGALVEKWVRVERIAPEGIGVQFLEVPLSAKPQ